MNVIPFPSAQARSVMAAVKARAQALHTQPCACQEAIRHAMHAMASGHSPAQAVRHAARDSFDVVVASQDALVLLLEAGVKVEDAEASDPQPSLIAEDAGNDVP